MNFMEFIEFYKTEISEQYPSVHTEDLDQFWNGGLMELQRMMFRNKKGSELYQVTYNSMTETAEVVKYVPEASED